MKVYNYISMMVLAGATLLAACSQSEELTDLHPDAGQAFRISVAAEDFQEVAGTRAVESGYGTRFTEGDAIGIFAVRGDAVVAEIKNRKFVLTDGYWELSDGGDPIEYKGSQFQRMTFYAYYPYNADVQFDPTKTDPFENYVASWTVGADQSEANYGRYDLMTSTGNVQGDRLKGQIAFTMQHRMALAVVKMPKLTYRFTNAGLTEYQLPLGAETFSLNGAVAQAYYQESTDTYRFLVNPGKAFSIKGTYTGVSKMNYEAKGTLESGTAKLYTIDDKSAITHTLQVGDYYCADGKIVSVDAEKVPENAIGIVAYVGNPQPHVTHPDKNTETNDALFRDFPGCTHGLVLALNDSQGDYNKFSAKGLFSTWFVADEAWSDKFTPCNTGNSTYPGTAFPGFKGYNNTTLLTMCYENGTTAPADPAYTYVQAYRTAVPVPAVTSVWYLPSLTELDQVAAHKAVLNTSIKAAGGTELQDTEKGTLLGFYWSSNERNDSFMWLHHMGGGYEFLNRERTSRSGYFRMMLAF